MGTYLLPTELEVPCSGSTILECRCGERVILLGQKDDWTAEGRTSFECGGCGQGLSLADAVG